MASPPRIAALLFRRVGDSLLATPALRAIKMRMPAAELTVLVEPGVARVFVGNPHVDRLLTVPPKPSPLVLRKHLCAGGRPDVVLDFLSDPRSALATVLSGATRRVGFAHRGRRWAYSDVIAPQNVEHPRYSADHKLDLARALGAETNDLTLEFRVTEDDVTAAEQEWCARSWDATTRVAALFVHSRRSYKRWPPVHFAEVIRFVQGHALAVPLILVTPGDEAAAAEVQQLADLGAEHLLTVSDLGVLGAVLKRCALLIGNDGGPKHLAVAMGTPTVTVFGREPAVYWTPPGDPRHVALQQLHAAAEFGWPSTADVCAAVERLLTRC